ncbi:MAG TPA: HNH endonuclease signature motif containing protein [Acidocella sp.]|nr:HNH endonuclease signature motif containing protein [Acidocella sp.]
MADDTTSTKMCPKCKCVKSISEFSKDHRNKDGLRSGCRECGRIAARAWKARNVDRVLQYAKDWAKQNPEKCLERDRRRNKANPGRTSAQSKLWRKKNKEREDERKRLWKSNNPEKVRAGARKTYAKSPEKGAAKYHIRRARKMQAEGSFSAEDIKKIRSSQKDKCAACTTKLHGGGDVDHITALVSGGSNWPRNLQLLCRPCNSKKHAKDPIDFMRELGKLL